MKTLTMRARLDLERAAELRAGGASWKLAAESIGRDQSVLRRWAKEFKADWDRFYQDAERLIKSEANSESMNILRDLMREKDPEIRLSAADKLSNLLLKQRAAEGPRESRSDVEAYLMQIEEMTNEELEDCIARFIAEFGPKPGDASDKADGVQGALPGMAGEAGTDQPD